MKKITRIWHGKTSAEHADDYLKYMVETGMDGYKKSQGNISSKILRRIDGEICHFLAVSEWDSYDNIKKFAGKDFLKAKYYPADKDYLLEFEEHVVHYETFEY